MVFLQDFKEGYFPFPNRKFFLPMSSQLNSKINSDVYWVVKFQFEISKNGRVSARKFLNTKIAKILQKNNRQIPSNRRTPYSRKYEFCDI